MIAAETWGRFRDNWRALGLAGLYAVLIIGLPVSPILLAEHHVFVTGAILWWLATAVSGKMVGVLLWGAALSFVAAFVMIGLVAPLAVGGLIHGVVQVQSGRPVTVGDLWQAGLRHWGRLFRLYLLIYGVWIGLGIAFLILNLVPVLGPTVWLVGAGMILTVVCGYGSYMVVTEGLDARQTLAKAYRILSDKFTDVLLTVLVLLAAGVVLMLVLRVLAHVPLIGWLLTLALYAFAASLLALYLSTRYRATIAPHFGPPGGAGTWDQGPPPGP